jgi:hypothetical protein
MSSVIISGDTSGSITLQSPSVAGTNTLTLPASTGTVLTTASNTNFPTGSVLQVVQGITTTAVSNSSSAFIVTGLTASITPSSASNKILVIINHPHCYKSNGNSSNAIAFWLQKNSSNLSQWATFVGYTGTATELYFSTVYTYLDSPSTTSSTTYSTTFSSYANASNVAVQANSMPSTITLMEIKA